MDEEAKRQLIQDSREISVDTSLFDLINALHDALKKTPKNLLHEIVTEEWTVDQKIHDILHLLVEHKSYSLTNIFARARSRKEIVTTFMAALELIRLKEILLQQNEMFGEIQIIRNDNKINPQDAQPVNPETSSEAASQ
jgi:segregation and condensation protein A